MAVRSSRRAFSQYLLLVQYPQTSRGVYTATLLRGPQLQLRGESSLSAQQSKLGHCAPSRCFFICSCTSTVYPILLTLFESQWYDAEPISSGVHLLETRQWSDSNLVFTVGKTVTSRSMLTNRQLSIGILQPFDTILSLVHAVIY